MNPDCIAQVAAKIGRNLSKKEQQRVVESIRATQSQIARSGDARYRAMTDQERIGFAAEKASQSIIADAQKAKTLDRAHLAKTIEKVGGLKASLKDAEQGGKAGAKMILADLRKLEVYQDGLQQLYYRDGLMGAINAIPSKGFGFLHDMKSMESFVKNLYEGAEASPQIKAAVKAWNDTAEAMRLHGNRLGMNVGKLDYNYLPQLYDVVKMNAVKADEFISDMAQWVDKKSFVDDAGRYIGDAEMARIISEARENIVTDGLAGRVKEGKVMQGKGGVRGRHDAHRVFHFKSADAHLAFAKKYGQGNILQAMSSHIHSMARDIAVLEHYGPKPTSVFAQMRDVAMLQDGAVERTVGFLGVTPQRIFDALSSGVKTVDQQKANNWQAARNIQSAAKLSGAVLSSMGDTVLITSAAWYNGMPAKQIMKIFKDFATSDADYKNHASRMGHMADSVISSVNRWAEGDAGYDITSRMADLTFRMGLLTAWTDGLKQAFSVNLSFTLGDMTRRMDWSQLNRADLYRFEKAGITQDVYDIWRASDLDKWDDHNAALSPEKIMQLDIPYADRVNASAKLLGYVKGMENIAVNTADIIHKGRMSQFTKGDTKGEIGRSMMQFKSYPASMLSRQLDLIGDIYNSRGATSAAGYTVATLVGLTMAGAVSTQAKQLVAGRDPLDIKDSKFWLRSTVQGGGLSFFGDLLYTGISAKRPADAASKVGSMFLGPLAGSAIELGTTVTTGLGKGADGMTEKEAKDTGAKMIKWLGSNVPVAPMDVWYTRTAIDRLIVDHLQEWASPGWAGRMRGNIKKEYGQDMWWRPTETSPRRAPDMGAAVGE